ncbi:MAG: SGNH/GDSL hydrolase family protein [Lentisphaerae bacterium]|jgi:lysophospholipase L1-like esterase|nr:SGNH/GDSL hydrolase family protein [Lentisphaerota bacterium]
MFNQDVMTYRLTGAWQIQVRVNSIEVTLEVTPQKRCQVQDEYHASVQEYNPKAGGYARGTVLRGVKADKCSTRYAFVPDSLTVKLAEPPHDTLQSGRDFQLEPEWGNIGCLPGGRLAAQQPVLCSYQHTKQRLDAIVKTKDGNIVLRQGVPHVCLPVPPPLEDGDTHLANVFIDVTTTALTDDLIFPILEKAFPEPPRTTPTPAEQLLPKTVARLKSGQPLRILAWGDSVTCGSFVDEQDRWQCQFVRRLQQAFPGAVIELLTEAWDGRSTGSYLQEPPGSIHNYQEKVLDLKPDLVISEFVNDAGTAPEIICDRYQKLHQDFTAIGAEWIILTPHYVRPDWMGLTSQKNIDADPRPYVKTIRKLAADNGIALADAALRHGRLWRQGIPYNTLMTNAINHPNAAGLKLFADALIALF